MAVIVNPFIVATLLTFVIVKLTSWLWHRYQKIRQCDELGLKGPPANLILGNFSQMKQLLAELNKTGDVRHFCADLIQKYGSTVRFLLGADLQVLTVDPKVIKEVFVTKFSKFTNRPAAFFNTYPLGESVLAVSRAGWPGRKYGWKEIRSTVQQSLRPSRIKMMFPVMLNQTKTLMNSWRKQINDGETKEFGIYDEFQALTVDVICECSFGFALNSVENRKHPFFLACVKLFSEFSLEKSWGMYLSMVFPTLSSYTFSFSKLGKCAYRLCAYLESLIKQRMKNRNVESSDLIETFLNENDRLAKEKRPQFHLDTIVSNCFALLLAGYDTTSNSMTYAVNLIGQYPEVAQRLNDEIQELFGDSDPSYDALMKAPYLDAFFRETLRFYPPITFFANRVATEDVKLESIDVTIPKGATIVAPVHLVCGQEGIWENPDEFNPERFLNRSTSAPTTEWMAFGCGPRNCVGFLFAEVEFKITVVEILKHFHISKTSPMNLEIVSVLLRPSDPVKVSLAKR
ncbi:unnamed protein product [Bursaphelenchus xylophilus]|uniref:(pine wood nematode) hypothetical protein n=1 Tax=Bursaphelenchus xylophilus TaxID=6326 RepID=A0A1I7SBM9_BURXY|nr:unnamed protein product [Bursaphelenchus xylophilus]CAG9114494.1 unnamed protein product [Bursaphelenchus xylophilus]